MQTKIGNVNKLLLKNNSSHQEIYLITEYSHVCILVVLNKRKNRFFLPHNSCIRNMNICVRFQVLKEASMKTRAFWDIAPRSFVEFTDGLDVRTASIIRVMMEATILHSAVSQKALIVFAFVSSCSIACTNHRRQTVTVLVLFSNKISS
jgi:hypothetical protein